MLLDGKGEIPVEIRTIRLREADGHIANLISYFTQIPKNDETPRL